MNFDESNNIIIEGDNLDVLKTLQASYTNKVDVIYIDPPYNTGNDFIYNDDFNQSSNEYKVENNLVDEDGLKTTTNQKTDGRFHTNWLNMMYPRLMLARKLLKEDGVIFISIDDNEQAHLKMICDEIFGEHNFVCDLVWLRNPGGESDNKHIAKTKDFVLFYAKNKSLFKINDLKKEIDILSFKKDENGILYKKGSMLEKSGENDRLIDRPNLGYVIYYHPQLTPSLKKIWTQSDAYDKSLINENLTIKQKIYEFDEELTNNGWIAITPREIKGTYGCWRQGEQTFLDNFYKNKYVFEKTKDNNWKIYEKEIVELNNPYKNIKPKDFISFTTNSKGTKMLKLIFGDEKWISNFKPKPVDLIKYLVNFHLNQNSIVLDFFAGSGTTGQAVMELNKEEGGNRKFILVQLPELIENSDQFKTISDITRERIKRSIEKYGYKEKGFKFFKLDESNIKSTNLTNQNSHQEFQQSLLDLSEKIKSNRSAEDVAYEIVLKAGLPFDKNLHQKEINNNLIFVDDSKSHLFILEPTKNSKYYENIIDVVEEFAKDIAGGLNIYLNDQYFKNDEAKINFVEQVKSISEQIKVWVI